MSNEVKPSTYFDIYKKRINRYGENHQERIQGQREKVFKIKVQESIYKVEFEYEGKIRYGTLERGPQDNTETLQYLLTETNVHFPIGATIPITDMSGKVNIWMVYYLEQIQASGYNKYIVLKMTHNIMWKDREGNPHNSECYIYGQEDNMLKDELRSRSRTHVLYTENIKLNFIVMPVNEYIKKDDYFTIKVNDNPNLEEAYVITGFDRISTPGVMFISMDPTPIRDKKSETIVPVPNERTEEKSFWLNGIVEDEYL